MSCQGVVRSYGGRRGEGTGGGRGQEGGGDRGPRGGQLQEGGVSDGAVTRRN